MKKAVVLSSGGLDSTTVMAIAASEGYQLFSLSFSYGQRHKIELAAAARAAKAMGVVDHLVLDIGLDKIGGSALTDDIDVPVAGGHNDPIPVTYVPARNTIFLSYALAWAETLHTGDIFIGVNAIDYSGYPDCRPEYIQAFETMANLATRAGVSGQTRIQIHTPLIHLTKAEIIQKGIALGVDYAPTISCYNPSPEGRACGRCDSCHLRKEGFHAAGVPDPTPYG